MGHLLSWQGMVSPFAVEMLLPAFLNGLAVKAKPPQKEATLQIISALAAKAPRAVGYLHLGGAAERWRQGGRGRMIFWVYRLHHMLFALRI